MNVHVTYQNLYHSDALNEYLNRKMHKVDKFIGDSSRADVLFKYANNSYVAVLNIHELHQDFSFMAMGDNLYDCVSEVIEKAKRTLSRKKKQFKDKIHRKLGVKDRQSPP